jgi:hypothetical protein
MANETFESYFATRTALTGPQGSGGDQDLVLRSGTVFRRSITDIFAQATITDNATPTAIAGVDLWAKPAGFTQGPTTAAFTYASDTFTFIGVNQVVPTRIKAAISFLTENDDDIIEVGVFINDALVGNAMSSAGKIALNAFVAAEVLDTFVTGDLVTLRVRNRTDEGAGAAGDVTLVNAQLIVG